MRSKEMYVALIKLLANIIRANFFVFFLIQGIPYKKKATQRPHFKKIFNNESI